jgi:TrpR-related protein YerC/YecD
MQVSPDDWRSPDVEALFDALLAVETREEAASFLRDLCTLGELRDLAQRWAVVRLLDGGLHYSEISRRTGASTATITRIASWLNHGAGGYRLALDRARLRSGAGTSAYPEADLPSYANDGPEPYPNAGRQPDPAPSAPGAPPAGISGAPRAGTPSAGRPDAPRSGAPRQGSPRSSAPR